MASPKPDEVNSLASRLSALDPAAASANRAEIGKLGLASESGEASGAETPAEEPATSTGAEAGTEGEGKAAAEGEANGKATVRGQSSSTREGVAWTDRGHLCSFEPPG